MRRWWQLGTRNWSVRSARTIAVVVAVAVGVTAVVAITSIYETARRAVMGEIVNHWLGAAHLSVHPPGAHHGALDAGVASDIAALENVQHVAVRLRRRMFLVDAESPDQLVGKDIRWVDAIGIDPDAERHFRTLPGLTGRMIEPNDRGVAVMEKPAAADWGVAIGDVIHVAPYMGGPRRSFTVVGLFDSERIADFQQPYVYLPLEDVRALAASPGAASVIDIMLDDPSKPALARTKAGVQDIVDRRGLLCTIESAEARQTLLAESERLDRMTLVLIAFVVQLTAFFIILTTIGMSFYRRRPQLGVMRCVGMTRRQIACLVFLEVLPLGLIGTALGLGVGIGGMIALSHWTTDMVERVVISAWGIELSIACGVATTIAAAGLLVLQVSRVTPLSAVHIHARRARMGPVWAATGAGGLLIMVHHLMLAYVPDEWWLHGPCAFSGAATLYGGYVLIAPAVVVLAGRPIAGGVGRLLGLDRRLAQDQFGRAPWRSACVCWVLMGGLSLITYVAERTSEVMAIWDFPARLPETFVWSPRHVGRDAIERVRALPAVADFSVVTDVECALTKIGVTADAPRRTGLIETLLSKFTHPVFVSADPDRFLDMMKIGFVEGVQAEAVAKLKRGGYVLIPTQTAREMDLHAGDRVAVTVAGRRAEFEIAGVIESPALDIAVTFFQATSYMQFAAASAVLGTRQDLQDKFGLDIVSMIMADLNLTDTAPPPDFSASSLPHHASNKAVAAAMRRWADRLPNEAAALSAIDDDLAAYVAGDAELSPAARDEVVRFARALRYVSWRAAQRTPDENWARLRERLVLLKIATAMQRPDAIMGSVRRLKHAVVETLRRATLVVTWVPAIALVVAAMGIANLMMVSVRARARQIAVLRAVGAVKSQIIRVVLAEAMTLGLLGCVIGLALGLHMAHSGREVIAHLTGFSPAFVLPVGTFAIGSALTVAACVIAGIGPARYAARDNIIDAMHVA
ncbi:MAG: FtsX-like permease family protein [Phycisphaerae bacterium]